MDDVGVQTRTREKNACCRKNEVNGDLVIAPGVTECGQLEVPPNETEACSSLEDCCQYDQWTDWSVCELSDGRR